MSEVCLLCRAQDIQELSHGLRRCLSCGFLFLTPTERATQQAQFLTLTTSVVDETHLGYLRKKYPKDDHGRKDIYAQYAKQAITWYGPGVRALDVGASGGFFLHELERRGADPSNLRTLEVDPAYQVLTEEYFGYEGDIADIATYTTNRTYNFITLFDVLEHVDDFWAALRNMHAMLTSGGRIVLKLPNARWAYCKYQLAQLIGRGNRVPYYLYIEPGGHSNYFDHTSIKRVESAGFALESFAYAKPTKQQFRQQYWPRRIAYELDSILGTHVFPEFFVTFVKHSE